MTYEFRDLDLRFVNKRCYCRRVCLVRVVKTDSLESYGRLYYKCDKCKFFDWCFPISVNGRFTGPSFAGQRMDEFGNTGSDPSEVVSMASSSMPSRMYSRTHCMGSRSVHEVPSETTSVRNDLVIGPQGERSRIPNMVLFIMLLAIMLLLLVK